MNDYKNFNKKYAHNIELRQKWLLIWVSEGIKENSQMQRKALKNTRLWLQWPSIRKNFFLILNAYVGLNTIVDQSQFC